jgi:hypothetical protein
MTQADQPANSATAAATAPISGTMQDLIASPDPGYRWKHLIMSVLLVAGGLWFAYDGWIKWPNENRRADHIQRDKDAASSKGDKAENDRLAKELANISKHSDLDIAIQKLLACALPAAGLFWGVWTLYETRGQLRMIGDTLEVPGHPPISYDNIRRIDKRKWDRKGVAYLHYEHGIPPQTGVLKLDDFAYERKPTDEILERIERQVLPATPEAGST